MSNETWDLIDFLQRNYKIEFVKERGEYKTTLSGNVIAYAKSEVLAKDGLPLFDYFSESDNYVGGIHIELYNDIVKLGFDHDWFDSDTIGFF